MLRLTTVYVHQMLLMTVIVSFSFASPISDEEYQWPSGLYTLPKAETQTSCPLSKTGIPWQSGSRYQDTESLIIPLIGGNEWSSPMHLGGSHGKLHMEWNFCSKADTSDDAGIEWGPGKYCIMKLGTQCPTGFDEGSVQWDDEDFTNQNNVNGLLPEGVYDKDTLIYFCCREDGTTTAPLHLPNTEPFILFMKEMASCQNVDGMVDSEEWFKWDGEDNLLDLKRYFHGSVPYHDGHDNNHKIHFCYYS